jgi:hypothetical protein
VLDIFYNATLLILAVFWLLSFGHLRGKRFIETLKKHRKQITAILWVIVLIYAAVFVMYFSYFDKIHDIDEAVTGSVISFKHGIDPYDHKVAPRFTGPYSDTVTFSMGYYNYLPLDLMAYSGAYVVFGWAGNPVWFVLSNLMFSAVAMFMIQRITRVQWENFIPVAGVVALFYSFDNASLTLMLMVASAYILWMGVRHSEVLSLFLMALAALTKVYAAVPFAILLIYLVQKEIRSRDWRKLGEAVVTAVSSGTMAVAMMIPFGIMNVINDAVLFHSSDGTRVGTSVGGTLLSDIMLTSPWFSVVGLVVVMAALLVSLRMKSVNDRMVFVSICLLLTIVKSSQAPLTVGGVFLAFKLREIYVNRATARPST